MPCFTVDTKTDTLNVLSPNGPVTEEYLNNLSLMNYVINSMNDTISSAVTKRSFMFAFADTTNKSVGPIALITYPPGIFLEFFLGAWYSYSFFSSNTDPKKHALTKGYNISFPSQSEDSPWYYQAKNHPGKFIASVRYHEDTLLGFSGRVLTVSKMHQSEDGSNFGVVAFDIDMSVVEKFNAVVKSLKKIFF